MIAHRTGQYARLVILLLVGISTSQYIVYQFVKNRLCHDHIDRTMQTLWQTFYKKYNCGGDGDEWKRQNLQTIMASIDKDKYQLVFIFYLWTMLWTILILTCVPNIWVGSLLSVVFGYTIILLCMSALSYFLMYPYYETIPSTYVYLPVHFST